MMTQNFYDTLVIERCCKCYMSFGVTQAFANSRKQDHRNFTCPDGHLQHYTGQTEAERLQTELREMEKRSQYWKDRLNEANSEMRFKQRALNATKGWLTRTKTRIANGVCPCCNRTFANLGLHMKTQHKNYVHGENE